MKLREEEEEERPFYGRTIGYCNRGPLYGRQAPYIHRAVCNRGELGRAFVGDVKAQRGRPKRHLTPEE